MSFEACSEGPLDVRHCLPQGIASEQDAHVLAAIVGTNGVMTRALTCGRGVDGLSKFVNPRAALAQPRLCRDFVGVNG